MRVLVLFFLLASVSLSNGETTDPRLQKILARFPEGDLNKDGTLTREEADTFRAQMQKKGKSKAAARQGPKPSSKRYTEAELMEIFEAREFDGLLFRLFTPEVKEGERYPLVLSLHGAGGKGSDNRKNLKFWNGILTEPKFQSENPCFVVAPQSVGAWRVKGSEPEVTDELVASFPKVWQKVVERRLGFVEANRGGNLGTVFALLDDLAEKQPIDTDRVYVLGHSMGGFGSFECLAMQPDRFAAAIPSAGGLSPWHDPAKFKHVPVWAFHGDQDTTVIPELTEAVFDRIKEVGGNMKFTTLGGVGHGANAFAFVYEGDGMDLNFSTAVSSDVCDSEEDVWKWLFSKKREKSDQ